MMTSPSAHLAGAPFQALRIVIWSPIQYVPPDPDQRTLTCAPPGHGAPGGEVRLACHATVAPIETHPQRLTLRNPVGRGRSHVCRGTGWASDETNGDT